MEQAATNANHCTARRKARNRSFNVREAASPGVLNGTFHRKPENLLSLPRPGNEPTTARGLLVRQGKLQSEELLHYPEEHSE
jgi:hypothetical protein